MSITATYAALLALLFIGLSVRTLRLRRSLRIPVGDGNNPQLLRAMRVHANFSEYVPLALLVIYFCELATRSVVVVHGLCLCLLVGRFIHALGVSQTRENYRYRVAGMMLTFIALGVAALLLLAVKAGWMITGMAA
jgi:uncharacterized protein